METRGPISPSLVSQTIMTSTSLPVPIIGDSRNNPPQEDSALADSASEAGIGIVDTTSNDPAAFLPPVIFGNSISTLALDSFGNPLGPSHTVQYVEGDTGDTERNGVSDTTAVFAIVDTTNFTTGVPRENAVPGTREIARPPTKYQDTNAEEQQEVNDDDDISEILNAAKTAEGEQDYDEDNEVPVGASASTTTSRISIPVAQAPFAAVLMTQGAMKKLKKEGLCAELEKRGVSFTGLRKEECLKLLQKSILLPVDPSISPAASTGTNKPVAGFPETAYWKELKAEEQVVPEPENRFQFARAPTVPEDESSEVPVKNNFAERFDREPFIGGIQSPKKLKNGRTRKDEYGNEMDFEKTVITRGRVRPEFLSTHGLDALSDPVEWMSPFWPRIAEPGKFSVAQCTTNSNLKASLMHAGPGGTTYPKFAPFTVDEIQKFMGIQIAQGLSPSPRVEMKFKSQAQDEINGNDLISSVMSPNGDERWRHFKAFFAIQDPRKAVPDRKKVPNFKIAPMLSHMLKVSPEAWVLGPNASVDEQTVGFQGHHIDKLRITYKNEGDGFQCDALCQDGYTYSFYYRNHPAPQKYIAMGLSPLHARVMGLFDTLETKYHRIGLDNLYNSAKFARAAYLHTMKVCVSGVTRKGMRGLPDCVLQDEAKNKKMQMKVRGTVKAALLMGDPDCPDLVATSVYDTKPVHFLSMTCDSIKWMVKTREVYCVDTQKLETIRFLRLNVNDDYNAGMGHVDVSDQLRNYYRMDHWSRKQKWWWAIYLWGLGVMLVNSYVCYKSYHLEKGTPKKNILTQFEFRRSIALAWMKPDEYWLTTGTKQAETSSAVKKRKRASPRNKAVRAIYLNDTALNAETGKLKGRVNHHGLIHLPVPPTAIKPICACHRWAGNRKLPKVAAQILLCKACKIHLCLDCFDKFHTEVDVTALRRSVLAK
jgi:hypothetical protein